MDLVGEFAANKETEAADKLLPRGVELSLYGAIDHLFDGHVSLAAHQEEGVAVFEIHEAYISSPRLVNGLNLKLGQYFIGIGRLNRIHMHEWPFISAPVVQKKFFDTEGVLDNGVEASYLLPLPFYLDVTVGVTNGFVYGHAHNEGKKPKSPTSYARLATFHSFGDFDVKPAINYLQRKAEDGTLTSIAGGDVTAKLKPSKTLIWLLQGEYWQRTVKRDHAKAEKDAGGYAYLQYGFTSQVSMGARFDYYSVTSSELKNSITAYVPGIGYQASEFSHWRFALNHEISSVEHQEDVKRTFFEVQSTFILGAHPAHAF